MAGKTKGRVLIPSNPGDLLKLAGKIYEKHQADGEASPLNRMEDNDWKASGPKVQPTLEAHTEAERLKGLMESKYGERDRELPGVLDIVRNSAALLKAMYKKNPKRLTDWGFAVDDTPQAPKPPKAAN